MIDLPCGAPSRGSAAKPAAAPPLAEDAAAPRWARPFSSLPAELTNAPCVIMTGGHRAFWPGIRCVLRQLRSVRTAHPLVVAAPAEDAPALRKLIGAEQLNASVVAWQPVMAQTAPPLCSTAVPLSPRLGIP